MSKIFLRLDIHFCNKRAEFENILTAKGDFGSSGG